MSAHKQPKPLLSCRDDALLTLVCSEPVKAFCYPDVEKCIYVDGPWATTVDILAEIKAAAAWPSYSLRISWQVRNPKATAHWLYKPKH